MNSGDTVTPVGFNAVKAGFIPGLLRQLSLRLKDIQDQLGNKNRDMDIYFSIEHDLSEKLLKSEYTRHSEGVFGKKDWSRSVFMDFH